MTTSAPCTAIALIEATNSPSSLHTSKSLLRVYVEYRIKTNIIALRWYTITQPSSSSSSFVIKRSIYGLFIIQGVAVDSWSRSTNNVLNPI